MFDGKTHDAEHPEFVMLDPSPMARPLPFDAG